MQELERGTLTKRKPTKLQLKTLLQARDIIFGLLDKEVANRSEIARTMVLKNSSINALGISESDIETVERGSLLAHGSALVLKYNPEGTTYQITTTFLEALIRNKVALLALLGEGFSFEDVPSCLKYANKHKLSIIYLED